MSDQDTTDPLATIGIGPVTRRGFFGSALQLGVAAAMLGVASVLIARPREQDCHGKTICGSCGVYGGCVLPHKIHGAQ